MSKLTDSLLSGSSGRTGRLVVANVAGTEILRVRPQKRKEATDKQLLIQQRMKICYDFLSSYKPYASKFFGVKVGMKSCYNLAMANLLTAFKINFETAQITPVYPEIAFSKGFLTQPVVTGISAPTAGKFTVEWYNNSAGRPERETDLAQILYVAEDSVNTVFMENIATRLDAQAEVSFAPNMAGKTIHVWLAFRDELEQLVSTSVYAGSVEVS